MAECSHLVVTIHGIRTYGEWQERLETLLKSVEPTVELRHYQFGYFSALAFLVPPLRWLMARRFAAWLRATCTHRRWDRIDVVAHSFGTHLFAWSLMRMPRQHRPVLHTVVCAGSVLRSWFPWHDLLVHHGQPGLGRLVNDCGTRDAVLLLSQIFSLFTGMAGRIGFAGMQGPNFVNRYWNFGHSGYFRDASGLDRDDHMTQHWLPLLTTDAAVQLANERGPLTAWSGLQTFLLQNAEILKVALFASVPAAFALVFLSLAVRETMARETARSRELVAQSVESRWLHPDQSRRLALEAWQLRPTEEAGKALEAVHAESNVIAVLHDPRGAPIGSAAFSRNGRSIITSNYWGDAWLWDAATLAPVRRFASSPLYRVTRDSLDGEGRRLLTATGDRDTATGAFKILVWDTNTGESVTFDAGYDGPVTSAVFSPDGHLIATASYDYRVYVRAAATGERLKVLRTQANGHSDVVNSVQFSKNGRIVLSASQDGRAKLWWWDSKVPRILTLRRKTTALFDAAFAPSDNTVVVTAGQDRRASLWDADAARGVTELHKPTKEWWHHADVRAVAFDQSGRQVATASVSGRAYIWDLDAQKALPSVVLEGHRGAVVGVDFSSDGRVLTASVDGTARIWVAKPVGEFALPAVAPRRGFLAWAERILRWIGKGVS